MMQRPRTDHRTRLQRRGSCVLFFSIGSHTCCLFSFFATISVNIVPFHTQLMSHASTTSPPSWGSSAMPVYDPQLENVIKHFYIKTAHIIIQSRLAPADKHRRRPGSRRSRLNKWFNITTEEYPERLRHDLRYWYTRALGSALIEPPPLMIDVYLDVPYLPTDVDDDDRQFMLDRYPLFLDDDRRRIILERWILTLSNDRPAPSSRSINNVYKRAILHFRSLYSFVRLLPAYTMKRYIVEGRGGSTHQSSSLGIGYRLSSTDMPRQDEVDLGDTLLSEEMDAVDEHTLSNLQTPLGTFNIQVRYRKHANFHIQEQDSSARFIDLDQQYFMPTITKFAKRSPPPPPWPNASPSPPPAPSSSSTRHSTSPDEQHHRPSSLPPSPSTAVVIPPPPPSRVSDRPHTAPFKKSPSSLSSSSNVSIPSTMTSSRPTVSFSSSFEKYNYSQSAPPLHPDSTIPASSSQRHPLLPSSSQRQSPIKKSSISKELSMVLYQEQDADLENFVRALSLAKPWRSPSLASSSASIYKSKQALTHFKSLRDTVDSLSNSMSVAPPSTSTTASYHPYRPRSPSPLQSNTTMMAVTRHSLPLAMPPHDPSFFMSSSPRLHHEEGDLLATSSSSSSSSSSSNNAIYQESTSTMQPSGAQQQRHHHHQEEDDSLIFRMSELELQ
ncbi:predicted protein [Lichtheimia corymbifera JMRC:FSU:9682]|uniref:Autophagy-related protein 13 n=1 Tax=Lichtheimia corymbifera JMRC:FSU:9682 TaxID=1263082 RepID=A0A068RN17_9FUNG|nr:predicted protein [Lichtheimia corymbifera JMRC:FSU:9682]